MNKWKCRKIKNLTEVTQLLIGMAGIQTQSFYIQSIFF